MLGAMGLRLSVESGWATATEPAHLDFDQDRIVIGRRSGCDVQLPHCAVSGHHATIRASGARYSLIDEDSTNGIQVNGKRIAPRRAKSLAHGDVIDLGGFSMVVSFQAIPASTGAEETAAIALRLLRAQPEHDLPEPTLYFLNGPRAGEEAFIPAAPSSQVLGRGDTVQIPVPDGDASREHAELVHAFDGVSVRDLGSKNGVLVNGSPITQRRLQHLDELRVGATLLRFEDPASQTMAGLLDEPDQAKAGDLPVGPSSPSAKAPAPSVTGSQDTTPEVPSEGRAPNTPAAEEEEPVAPVIDEASQRAPSKDEAPRSSLTEMPPANNTRRADVMIYALAGVVLALSAAGLYWLFQ